MRFVIDTNILAAALIKNSVTREILVHPRIACVLPEFTLYEIEKYKEEFLQKSQMSAEQFMLLLEQIKSNIIIIPAAEITHREEAMQIMDHVDPGDTIFIALALSVENDGIWSEDHHFEKQNSIKIWKTKDLIRLLGIVHH